MKEHRPSQPSTIPSFWQLLSGGIPVGRIGGIDVFVHPLLALCVLFWLFWAISHPGESNSVIESLFEVVTFAGILFGSVLLHELGHCAGARLVGGTADRILLWPLGGLANVEGMEKSPYNEFIITILGPAVSLVLGVTFSILLWVLPFDEMAMSATGRWILLALIQARMLNWSLFLFNMCIPLFPMDCARLIRSGLSMRFNAQRVTYNLCLVGLVVAGFMLLLGLAVGPVSFTNRGYNILLPLIGLFGIQSCLNELQFIRHSYVYTQPHFGRGNFEALLRGLGMRMRRRSALLKPRTGQIRSAGQDPTKSPVSSAASRTAQVKSRSQVAQAQETPAQPLSERDLLRVELEQAVKREDFLRAAELRDRLKALPPEETSRV